MNVLCHRHYTHNTVTHFIQQAQYNEALAFVEAARLCRRSLVDISGRRRYGLYARAHAANDAEPGHTLALAASLVAETLQSASAMLGAFVVAASLLLMGGRHDKTRWVMSGPIS